MDANEFLDAYDFRQVCDELEKYRAKVKRLTETLEDFADYGNPNELKNMCWPMNEVMAKARKALAEGH